MAETKGTIEFEVRYDLRNPLRWRKSWPSVYGHFLNQVASADELGYDVIQLNEHHFSEDGYMPSPVVMASAVAARTSQIRIRLAVVILPLKHPVQLAEDLAIVDNVSNGRLELLVGAGYRAEEYAGYGIAFDDRGKRMEEALVLIRRCWTEDGFDFEGNYWDVQNVIVQPKPAQSPHPALVVGGSSLGAARRAARVADGFAPTNFELLEHWQHEMERLGKDWESALRYTLRTAIGGASFTHISENPDESWQLIREQLHYIATSVAGWTKQRPGKPHATGETPEDLLTTGAYAVITPEAAIEQGKAMISEGMRVRLSMQPMLGGIPWEEGQRSLDLVTNIVMPQLRAFANN
jgi:alkanesulfonate monooxygenase SsuD/methylene tetrahydromethanopterin reductase-like flavin-dependent oxidoreductase (luciferase family)